MKLIKLFNFFSFFLLSCSALQAHTCSCQNQNSYQDSSTYGMAGFGVTDPNQWYTVTTHSYPEVTPLSQQRNKGLSEGGAYLSPTGFTIGEEGNYWVEITVILQNSETDALLIPFFLVKDETFDEENPLIGGIVTLPQDHIITGHGTGILQNVKPGTRLSIVATNAGYPLPQDVKVVGWGISLFKLP